LVKAQIRRTVGTTETLLADFAITINDDTTGLFTISLSHTTTAALVLNDNASDAYDIQLTTASGVVTTYVSGNVVLVGDVTR
jgi:hypothetical protein